MPWDGKEACSLNPAYLGSSTLQPKGDLDVSAPFLGGWGHSLIPTGASDHLVIAIVLRCGRNCGLKLGRSPRKPIPFLALLSHPVASICQKTQILSLFILVSGDVS